MNMQLISRVDVKREYVSNEKQAVIILKLLRE